MYYKITNTNINAILYTLKELVLLETSLTGFHEKFYIP